MFNFILNFIGWYFILLFYSKQKIIKQCLRFQIKKNKQLKRLKEITLSEYERKRNRRRPLVEHISNFNREKNQRLI